MRTFCIHKSFKLVVFASTAGGLR